MVLNDNKEFARCMRENYRAESGIVRVSEELWLQIADVVEVVRCKNCGNYCKNTGECNNYGHHPGEDGYCSGAIPKKDVTDTNVAKMDGKGEDDNPSVSHTLDSSLYTREPEEELPPYADRMMRTFLGETD